MQLSHLIHHHPTALIALSNRQRSAANAITGCRTEQYGHLLAQCGECDAPQIHPHSCGHRSCPQCLNHCTSDWLDRQSRKLLPCDYYMVTFTLPKELRDLAKQHSKTVFDALMSCAASTLKTFALNDAKCGDHIGLTVILHTHTRRLDYHPHAHVIIPNGGLSRSKTLWQCKPGDYLFNSRTLATVFRASVLKTLQRQGLDLPDTPKRWVAHCKKVGRGLPALQYLSRYLYRGVISEKNILSDRDGQITFGYRDNQQQNQTRTLSADHFIKLVLQHVLPKGFRRVRDYGFLHGNAKQTLNRVQRALQVNAPIIQQRPRPTWRCKHCGGEMHIVHVYRRRFDTG
jgi:hypothetical protein